MWRWSLGHSQGARVVVGRQVLFTQAAMILLGLQQRTNDKRLDGVECSILSDTAEALHEADGWRRFATLGHGVGEDAKETYALLARVAGPVKDGDVWTAFWGQVHAVEGTLKTLSGGGTPTSQQLAAAMEFCTKASNQGPITAPLRRVR